PQPLCAGAALRPVASPRPRPVARQDVGLLHFADVALLPGGEHPLICALLLLVARSRPESPRRLPPLGGVRRRDAGAWPRRVRTPLLHRGARLPPLHCAEPFAFRRRLSVAACG